MTTVHWQTQAACHGWVDVFDQTFDAGRRTSSRVHTFAADVCNSCPVRKNCLTEALNSEGAGDRFGMRGGLMPVERNQLARRSA